MLMSVACQSDKRRSSKNRVDVVVQLKRSSAASAAQSSCSRLVRHRSVMKETQKARTKRRCLIFGAGGHGRVVLDILVNMRRFEVVGFVDSNPNLMGRRIDGAPVVGAIDDLTHIRRELDVDCAIVAIGDNGIRRSF